MGFKWGQRCCECDFYDDFFDAPSGYTAYEHTASSEAPIFDHDVANDRVVLDNGSPVASGTYYRSVNVGDPDRPDFFLRVSAAVRDIPAGAEHTGVFVGNFQAALVEWAGHTERYTADSVGEIVGGFGETATTSVNDGDIIALEVFRENGLWVLQHVYDGVVMERFVDVTPDADPGETWNVGMVGLLGGQWDSFEIECSGVPSGSIPQCNAGGMYRCWEITVAGITDDTCSECTDLNGTFLISYNSGCLFLSPLDPAPSDPDCGVANQRWTFEPDIPAGGDWILIPNGSPTLASYSLPGNVMNGFGNNTWELDSNDDGCANWPATLTMVPSLC